MNALISIPDLDGDTIYPLEGANQADSQSGKPTETYQPQQQHQQQQHQYHSGPSSYTDYAAGDQAARPRPFRGAELEHSRSGSVVSFESNTGSRVGGVGGGVGAMFANLAGRGGGNQIGANTASNVQAAPGFPRKSSFASLKAAFKGPSMPATQDAYPPQLRNPFSSGGNQSANGKTSQFASDSARMHGRNDSHLSSNASRGKAATAAGISSSSSSSQQRHAHQNSLYSDHSLGASTSHSESTTGTSSIFRSGPTMPPMPPFPEAYAMGGASSSAYAVPTMGSLPPARTAYARSMSVQAGVNTAGMHSSGGGVVSSEDNSTMPANARMTGIHERSNSSHSSLHAASYSYAQQQHQTENDSAKPSWMQDGVYFSDLDGPLQPPQPGFAGSWHQRGSSRGSRDVSEDGTRPSFDQESYRNGIASRPHAGSAFHAMPPVADNGNDRYTSRQAIFNRENSSVASLPSGIGLDEPVSPADYAINVLCSRFITLAGVRIRTAIGGVDESDPLLERNLGEGADTAVDTLLDSLAHVSRKNPGPVIKSLLQWRDNMTEDRIDVGDVRGALAGSQAGVTMGVRDVANVLTRRKVLATAYLLSRALIKVANTFSPGTSSENSIKGLSDAQVSNLQSRTFDLMRECSRERWPPSRMQADAFESASQLLGVLSKVCFAAVGDRFVAFLEQCQKANPNPKDGDTSTEVAVAAVRHLKITSFPMELFEEGAEFLEVMARNFAAAHGQRLKITYAESLTSLLLPVAKSASAELHHPTWIKALEAIAPRAVTMISKPRYWNAAYSLLVAVLCASPEETFLQPTAAQGWSWVQCLDAGIAKFSKDRSVRTIVLNAGVFLIWTYLFRCKESSSTTSKRLESFFRTWFPPQRLHIFPSDVNSLDWHIYMTHYVLYRQFEFGRDLVLDFLRAQALSGNTLSLQPDLLSKQRMTIAVRAILLTLDAHVKESSPPFPADANFASEMDDLGDQLPESFTYPTADIGTAQAQFNDLIGKIALLCNHQIGTISVFDDQVTLTRGTSVSSAMAAVKGTNDEERLCWRVHSSHRFIAAYNKDHQPFMDLLRACIDSWPRCLSANIPFANALTVLHRAFFSADPQLAESAVRCLTRIAEQRKGGATAIVTSFMRWILRVDAVYWETHPNQHLILTKIDQAVKLLTKFLNIWLTDLRKGQSASNSGTKRWEMERTSAWAIIDEVEATGLFLLCSAWRPLRRHAISILRLVSTLDDVFAGTSGSTRLANASYDFGEGEVEKEDEPTRIIHLLVQPCTQFLQSTGESKLESSAVLQRRLEKKKWKRTTSAKETLAELAESDKSSELTTWLFVVPQFLRTCLEHFPTTVAVFRSLVTNRILAMESAVSGAAGTSNRPPASGSIATLKGQAAGAAVALMPFAIGNNANNSSSAASGNAAAAGALTPEQHLMAEHWKMYILALCTTTTSIEGSAHRMKANDGSSTERTLAAKDLFQKLVPYLGSDHARFREAVITALGNINANLYKTLLETLLTVNAQLSEEFRRSTTKRNRDHERLRTALGHVIQLTSPHMTSKRTFSDTSIALLILQWVKETFTFLTDREVRLDWELHRLRRFFAGVVEEFFDTLYKPDRPLDDVADRFLTFETRIRMFRLFRDWHSFSQAAKEGPAKLANLLASVAEQYREERNREAILTALRNETQLLSFHASSAMAALCQRAITVTDGKGSFSSSAASQTNGLEASSLIDWLKHLFLSPSPQNHTVASRALKALLLQNSSNRELIRLTLQHSFSEPEQTTASRSFFAVFADVVVEKGSGNLDGQLPLSIPQILCLGLVKLGHPDSETRKRAFVLLSSVTPAQDNLDAVASTFPPPLLAMEGGVSSPLPATYLRAQRDVSSLLADLFQEHKIAMLSEYTLRLPDIDLSRRATTLGLLPEWLQRIQYTADPGQDERGMPIPRRSMLVLSNLLAMTIRYGDEHNFEIQDMWASLAEGEDYAANATIIVKFLVQQALAIRSSTFIMHAKRAVSCLSHTVLAHALFSEFCSYIEPSSMIPVPLDQGRLTTFDPQFDHLYLANIETHLPPPSRRQTFSPGQVALLFVGELAYDRSSFLIDNLPLLLHAIFMHVDSVSAFTQEQVMTMFEQLMRSINAESGRASTNCTQADRLFGKGTSIFWTQDEADFDASHTPRVMRTTVMDTIAMIKPYLNDVNQRWGNVALYWATSNPVRHMACRSFQMFRILMPDVNYSMLADILGRLSNTISDSVRIDNQSFALEILYTMKAVARTIDGSKNDQLMAGKNSELLGHIFWMNVACLSTVNEAEFGQAVGLMHILLERIDLDSEEIVSMLTAQCPDGWEGEMGGLQNLVMRGLKSSTLYKDTFALLARISRINNDRLIDGRDSRIGYIFMVSLPWFLEAADNPGRADESMVNTLAEDIARLAETSGKADVERVATSIAKKRFRTKDDLLRQAVNSCVRAGFLPNHATGMTLTLLGMVFNAESWLRKQTLQVLKIFFQSVDSRRQDFSDLGPELLMPLLRLLSTDLSMEVLEVLEEKILLTAQNSNNPQRRGPNAHQIVRMSLQWHTNPNAFMARRGGAGVGGGFGPPNRRPGGQSAGARSRDGKWHATNPSDMSTSNVAPESNSLFGMPEESGWSVADIPDWTSRTRINTLSVFKSVELLLDTPPVGEVNFVDDYDADGDNVFEQNMTASRLDADEMESASMQQQSSVQARSGGGASGPAVAGPDQSSLTSQPSLMEEMHAHRDDVSGAKDDEKVNVGDIISQLHDLSSFFIDDDFDTTTTTSGFADDADLNSPGPPSATKSRYSRRREGAGGSSASTRLASFWGTSSSGHGGGRSESSTVEESGEQIAKILSRSALASMMGRTAGVVSAAARSASSGHDGMTDDRMAKTPTPGAGGFASAMGDTSDGRLSSASTPSALLPPSMSVGSAGSVMSNGVGDESLSPIGKRSSMWGRKSLFGRRPILQSRSASETHVHPSNDAMLTSSPPPPLPLSASASSFAHEEADADATLAS